MKINEIEQLTEGPHDPHTFKAIIMAGAPGSGKTTIGKRIVSGTGVKEVNIDKFIEMNINQTKEVNYNRANDLTNKSMNNYLTGRLGLLIDGTGRNKVKIAEVKHQLNNLGYDVMMVFVNVTLETAKKRAATREKVTGRKVDLDFLEVAYEQSQKNIGAYQSMFGGKLIVIDNEGRPDYAFLDKNIMQFLNSKPQNPIAYEWLKSQLKSK